MKIAFFDIKETDKDFLRNSFPGDELILTTERLTLENFNIASDCEVLSVRERSKVKKEIINNLPKLRLVATRTTGYDHVDFNFGSPKKLELCNVPAYGQNTVAEHVFALILSLSRRIHKSKLKDVYDGLSEEEFCGFDLFGKTLGIVGTGHIGSNVARIAKGFGMNIIGYDLYKNQDIIKEYGLKYVTLEELLKLSDIISIHLPLSTETRNLINRNNISLIKTGSILINTARGGIVETQALIDALKSQKLAGAGLDVLENEHHFFRCRDKKELKDDIDYQNFKTLLNLDVVITPHNAFNTKEAYERIMKTTVENILQYKSGKPVNLIIQ